MSVPHRPGPAVLPASQICLFLDFDGTLVEFAPAPDGVHVEAGLFEILRALHAALQGAVALVSGRPLSDIDELLKPLRLPSAGLHGLERRDAAGRFHRPQFSVQALDPARLALKAFVAGRSDLRLEDKGAALAVHYRGAPRARELVRSVLARVSAPLFPRFEILEGDMVVEIKPTRYNKASAVEEFMGEEPFVGRVPVFVGDDVTDYDGFAAVRRLHGLSVAVGDRVSAQWYLPDPRAARAWLAQIAGLASRHDG
ncbi:MAG TPA: trehalose-phosphatase [Steroidobacteraceae bacterium]|nr:trehalose-phosphatase [Steroidobacteraceae bacterium]